MVDLAILRTELETERDGLIRRLNELGFDMSGGAANIGADEGFADSGSVAAEKGELLALSRTVRDRLENVVAALSRIDTGTYGKCRVCGDDISTERLEFLPSATLCVTDAAAAKA